MSAAICAGSRRAVALPNGTIVNCYVRAIGDLRDSTATVRLDTGEVLEVPWQDLRAYRRPL